MLRLTLRRGVFAVALTAIGLIAALMAGARGSSALGLQATWTMSGRTDAVSFRPGPQLPASGRAGFAVISFAAAGPSARLPSYVYGGVDAAPGATEAAQAFVTCDAVAAAGALTLNVGNAFPYAGCVFFPRVTNTGDGAIEVDLGALTHPTGVFCGQPSCKVDVVVGGLDQPDVDRQCSFDGVVARSSASPLRYRLDRNASLTCPIFVVLLQPAAEATTYSIVIEAPRPQDPATDHVEVEGATPPPSTSTTPTAVVAGATPQPPRTGFGLVVGPAEAQPGDGTAMLAIVSFLALLSAVVVLGLPRRRRDDAGQMGFGEESP